jgi:hypothetical protein
MFLWLSRSTVSRTPHLRCRYCPRPRQGTSHCQYATLIQPEARPHLPTNALGFDGLSQTSQTHRSHLATYLRKMPFGNGEPHNVKESPHYAPILQQADLSKPFTLRTDASSHAIGAALLQGEENEKGRSRTLVAYSPPSRKITLLRNGRPSPSCGPLTSSAGTSKKTPR